MKFYTTTPIYYVNDKPHLGTAYATCMAEIMNQYRKLIGFETLFLTGVDEHGQKIQQAAEKRKISPQEHCDEFAQNFIETWKNLEIENNIFYRTSSPDHKKSVQTFLQKLYDHGDVYEQNYEGWYCVSDETFYPEDDLIDGKSPTGKPVERISEKNYFFKMSKYQNQLIDHIKKNPDFIQPESKKNEVLGFLSKPLEDLSISRPASRIHWGIPLPFDKEHVTYVWVDALSNYAIAVGLFSDDAKFNTWWNEATVQHIIGKDILITHAVYWTTLLFALKIKLPDQIFAHGWILNKDSGKMSKSEGEVLDPLSVVNEVGLESFKYYIASEIRFGNDAPFSQEMVIQKVNSDLANTLGNLLSRSTNLIEKFYNGLIPEGTSDVTELKTSGTNLYNKVKDYIIKNEPHMACAEVISYLKTVNQFVENKAPWKLAKENPEEAGIVLRDTLEALRISAILLSPILKKKMASLFQSLNYTFDLANAEEECQNWYGLNTNSKINKPEPLFPRI
jgi:methionyl-tRNA synthetase